MSRDKSCSLLREAPRNLSRCTPHTVALVAHLSFLPSSMLLTSALWSCVGNFRSLFLPFLRHVAWGISLTEFSLVMGRVKENYGASNSGRPLKLKPFMTAYITAVHVAAVYGLWLLLWDFSLRSLASLVVCYCFSAVGITGGAHRLWAHKAYSAKDPFRFFLMIANCMANQGSIYHWCAKVLLVVSICV